LQLRATWQRASATQRILHLPRKNKPLRERRVEDCSRTDDNFWHITSIPELIERAAIEG
jgi:hypothetical protein